MYYSVRFLISVSEAKRISHPSSCSLFCFCQLHILHMSKIDKILIVLTSILQRFRTIGGIVRESLCFIMNVMRPGIYFKGNRWNEDEAFGIMTV